MTSLRGAALVLGLGLAAAGLGCDRGESADRPKPTAGGDATNTGLNARDRNESAKTPTDQAESASDRDLTQRIRQALMKDDSLSTNAHNVKIITSDGKVTLRGPVDNEAERNKVVQAAEQVAPGRVTNQLDVASR